MNLGNVGLGSGQPERSLLSGASCGEKEACSRFVVYRLPGVYLTSSEDASTQEKYLTGTNSLFDVVLHQLRPAFNRRPLSFVTQR